MSSGVGGSNHLRGSLFFCMVESMIVGEKDRVIKI